jgi:hypothetical protein
VLQELGGLVAEGDKTPKEEFDAYLQAVADDMRSMDYEVQVRYLLTVCTCMHVCMCMRWLGARCVRAEAASEEQLRLLQSC